MAAYYAKEMGVPIGKLICASNENKVLYDFFRTGSYDRNREFVLTTSPSMDILISSNLERLIYKIAGADDAKDAAFMKELSEKGVYTISPEMKEKLTDFYGNYASEEETAAEIARLYKEADYVIDTHTAVASAVYRKYRQETGDEAVTVIVLRRAQICQKRHGSPSIRNMIFLDDFGLVDELSVSGTAVPKAVEELRTAPVLHDTVVEKDEMKSIVKKILNVK